MNTKNSINILTNNMMFKIWETPPCWRGVCEALSSYIEHLTWTIRHDTSKHEESIIRNLCFENNIKKKNIGILAKTLRVSVMAFSNTRLHTT